MKAHPTLDGLLAEVSALSVLRHVGRVTAVRAGTVEVSGLADVARVGDLLRIDRRDGALGGEVLQLHGTQLVMLPDSSADGVALDDAVTLCAPGMIAPCDSWIGRIIDPAGLALDGRPIVRGAIARPLRGPPPSPADRRSMGARLSTGMAVMNTFLPVVRGQRVGLFAGSGVGKSSLLGHLAQNMEADVVVIAMIGERGRELRHFVEDVLGAAGLARSVIVCATSDQSPLIRRRCAWSAMTVAEHFRDQGKSVLLLADSITRFAEAHREVAVAAGEAPVLRGFPPSTAHMLMSLCERAGPGAEGQGDITALFTVLVAGSDMDEPVADILRGVLDGHIVLDRTIAERGRYPAIDVLRSISRSLPAAATKVENQNLLAARRLLGIYDRNATMISAGLYTHGSDPDVDLAIGLWSELDAFIGRVETGAIRDSFDQLALLLRRAKVSGGGR